MLVITLQNIIGAAVLISIICTIIFLLKRSKKHYHEPDACDVVAVDMTTDEDLPGSKGGIA